MEVVVDIDNEICPCCQGELQRIGGNRSARLDLLAAQFRILVTRRWAPSCIRRDPPELVAWPREYTEMQL
ncbi:IS66 family transposase zinc-finger binding domain-containing protein [Bradyrhizobium sp. HKCCYLRH1073]|uniref:IS66 family transposase zinc-finger binding domain-containing protein n=1 Tax=unclassified Bradyrhizobium TaxID=2631580 RepID=UPI0039673E2D